MNSDSSDDENLDLLREAADSQFINDSMFNEETSKSALKENISSSKEALRSLRKAKDEDEQFNLFRVTPEFRNYVAKHLSKALEEKIQKLLTSINDNNNLPKKTKGKSGVRLFSTSKIFLKVEKNLSATIPNTQITVKPSRNSRYSKVSEDLLRQVAVASEDILSKKDIKYWSNRSKAPVFNYKKTVDGKLVLVEREYK